MRTLKLTLSYDGTRFVGWQRQREGESIQGLLEDALARFEGAPVSVQGAGRTDAGVHALGQVASVRVTCAHDTTTLTRALNAHLPEDIRVLAVEERDEAFHARFSARAKTYRYQIRNGAIASPFERAYVWHLIEPLALDAMNSAAGRLVGTHDFAAFRSAGSEVSGTVRTITRSAWRETPRGVYQLEGYDPQQAFDRDLPAATTRGPRRARLRGGVEAERPVATSEGHTTSLLTYEISGDGFLRHMVRAIVGTLVDVGRGWRDGADIGVLLQGGTRAQAGATAPPQGLFLVSVDYD